MDENYMQKIHEDISDSLYQSRYGTEPEVLPCPICDRLFIETASRWIQPHPCAYTMNYKDAYICGSKECTEKWFELNWEEVEEFEEKS